MNRTLLMCLALLVTAIPLRPQVPEDPHLTPQYDSANGVYSLSWYGWIGKTYRVQRSADLYTWIYLTGSDLVVGRNTTESVTIPPFDIAPRFFLRLEVGTDLHTIDSDGDGLSDYDEIYVYHTDPYNKDTNGDGVDDNLQVGQPDPNHPGDPTYNQANNTDTDGDGVPNDQDGCPLDPQLHFPRVPETRYALIDLDLLGFPKVSDINDALLLLDTTYHAAKVWNNGQITSIPSLLFQGQDVFWLPRLSNSGKNRDLRLYQSSTGHGGYHMVCIRRLGYTSAL